MNSNLFDRVKRRVADADLDDDVIYEYIESAIALYLSRRYPSGKIPLDKYDMPKLSFVEENWVIRCAEEMISRIGAEGQVSGKQSDDSRGYDAGTISKALLDEVVPIMTIARAR